MTDPNDNATVPTDWIDRHMPRPDPMSDATVEAVARAFCKRMGLDPDANLVAPLAPVGRDARQRATAQWQLFSASAREAIAMHLAVHEVLG